MMHHCKWNLENNINHLQHDFKIKFDILLGLNENENGIYLLNVSLTTLDML
jgi:hypothetical protein